MSRSALLEDDNVLDVTQFIVIDDEIQAKSKQLEEEKRRSRLLLICFIAMIFFGLGNKIFQILQMIPMENYPLFLSNLTTFAYVPLSFAYILPVQRWGTSITPEMEAVPKIWFFYIGALDSIAGIMQTLSINYIQNGTLVVLVMQLAIPISMIISKIMLKARYKLSQIMGCIIVAAGLAVVLIPTFLNKKKDECDAEVGGSTLAISLGVLVLSNIPMCLSTVVKEKTLGDSDVDPVYLNGWVAIFQFLFGIPLTIPAAPTVNVAIKDIFSNLIDGAKCYVGINTKLDPNKVHNAINALSSYATSAVEPISNRFFKENALLANTAHATNTLSVLGNDDECDNTVYDDCAMSPIYVNVYMFFNIAYNILIILIIKYGSSNILYMALTVMVPLSSLAFTLNFMPNHKSLKITDIIGLVVILGGLVVYRFYTQIRQKLFGKTLEDLAEEQQRVDEANGAYNAASQYSGINTSQPVASDEYEPSLIGKSQPSSYSTSDSYLPPVLSDYTEAEVAPGIDVNAVATKKKKKSRK